MRKTRHPLLAGDDHVRGDIPRESYALKIDRGGEGVRWLTGLSILASMEHLRQLAAASEASGDTRYWTAAIYHNAMCVAIFRYYPARMRTAESGLREQGGEAAE